MKIKKFAIPILMVFLVALLLFGLDKAIAVKSIVCKNQYSACSSKIEESLNEGQGKGLFSAKRDIGKRLEKEFFVKDFSFHYQPPSELIVNVVERRPHYALENQSIEWVALIDKEGYGLSLEEESGIPVLLIEDSLPNPGERVGDKVLFALEIFSALTNTYNIKTASLTGGQLAIELGDEINVLFPIEGDKQVLLGSFVFIYNQVKDNEEVIAGNLDAPEIKTIDLRFKNPVIR